MENENVPFIAKIEGSKETHYLMVKNRVNELLKNCADAETISDFIDVRQNQEKFINFLFTIYIHISIF